MSKGSASTLAYWVTRRSHVQISHQNVLPVLFKAQCSVKDRDSASATEIPPAFPDTDVRMSDALPLIKDWLHEHMDRVYRLTPANLKPGTLETPDVLRSAQFRFTLWLEPTSATFALLSPSKDPLSISTIAHEGAKFSSFSPTPQTLHITAELNC